MLCCVTDFLSVFIYRERACARCGGCDSRLQFPFVCVHIALAAFYSPPSESAVRERKGQKDVSLVLWLKK